VPLQHARLCQVVCDPSLPCILTLAHTPTHPHFHKVGHRQGDQNDTATHTNTHKWPRARERSEWEARTVARGSALAALRIARAMFLLGPQSGKHGLGGNLRIYQPKFQEQNFCIRIIVQLVFNLTNTLLRAR
jgi:hypothetical protein